MNAYAAQILERASDRLERYGWTQQTSQNGSMMCAAMSLIYANGGFVWDDPVIQKAAHALLRVVDPYGDASNCALVRIAMWNDSPYRTAAEVISTLRAVAVTLRAQQQEPHTGTEREPKPQRIAETV